MHNNNNLSYLEKKHGKANAVKFMQQSLQCKFKISHDVNILTVRQVN